MIVPISTLMRLPEVPNSRRGVEKLLKRIGARRIRRGSYEIDSAALRRLSEIQVVELLKRHVAPAAPAVPASTPAARGLSQNSLASVSTAARDSLRSCVAKAPHSDQIDTADCRAELCSRFEEFRAHAGAPPGVAVRRFAQLYNDGAIAVSDETRARFPQRSAESIQRDWRAWKTRGAQALVPGYGNRHDDGVFDREPAMRELVLAMIMHQPHVRVARIHEALRVRFPDRAPSIRTIERFVARWKAENPSLFLRLKNPDAWRQKFSVALGRADGDIVRAGQLHEIDGTRLEVQCTDGLFHLNAIIDVFTRRMVCTLSPSASAAATAALLRKSLVRLGVPKEIKSDWGAEYINARIERAARRMEIHWHKVARPYSGELKPFIERGQGTILHMFFEQCPGYRGHSVAEATEIRARHSFQQRRGERRNITKLYDVRLSSAELQELLDRWLEHVYGNRPHAGLHGKTPNEVFREAEARGEIKRVSDERALDLLLGEDGVAVVGSKGIRVAGALFWDDALIEWSGRQIEWIRTRDAGKLLIFSHSDRPEFICVAIDLESAGVDRQVVAFAATQRQKQVIREQLDELKRLKRAHRPENLLREVIDSAQARAIAALPPDAPVVVSPLPYRSEGIRAAADALAALETRPAAMHDEEILQRGEEILHAMDHEAFHWPDADESDALYVAIRDEKPLPQWAAAYFSRVGASATEWAANYEGTDEWRAYRKLERFAADDADVKQRAAIIAAPASSRRAKTSTYTQLAAAEESLKKAVNGDG